MSGLCPPAGCLEAVVEPPERKPQDQYASQCYVDAEQFLSRKVSSTRLGIGWFGVRHLVEKPI